VSSKLHYEIVGTGPYGVKQTGGGLLYDLLETFTEARDICLILNKGIGPEWDEVEAELNRIQDEADRKLANLRERKYHGSN
jgi:hypothetical protein